MKTNFLQYLQKHKLISKKDQILVAVSGGIDSMVLLKLLYDHNYVLAIAHCNFKLREKESDDEEKFVRKLAKFLNVKIHVNQFNTAEYAKQRGLSIQMAARELRYEWFEQLAKENNYTKIALAHHLDDQVETVLLNLTRGTGLMGLTGMEARRGKIIRPLLFATRYEILQYAKSQNIKWKEDSSNSEDKYARNAIRHHVIPHLKEINKGFYSTFQNSEQRIRNAQTIYEKQKVDFLINSVFEGGWRFSIESTLLQADTKALFKELLFDFGFSHSAIENVINGADRLSGKVIYGNNIRLVKNRKEWILTPLLTEKDEYLIRDTKSIEEPLRINVKVLNNSAFTIKKNPSIAYLDFDKLSFPLKLRKWKKGDWFIPFGMKGKVKLSDYFVNHKFSLIDKEEVWVLESGKDIVWLVGHRLDERYKVGENTKKVYLAQLKQLKNTNERSGIV